jgi:hypothetical protein
VPSSLLFSVDGTSDYVISDSELIRSIVAAKSTQEVDKTLRDAFERIVSSEQDTGGINKNGAIATSLNRTSDLLGTDGETETILCLNEAGINATIAKFPQFSLNVTAAALRRLAHVSIQEARAKNSDPETQVLLRDLLASLLQTISGQIIWAQRSSEGSLGVLALSDILQGLAVLSNKKNLDNMQPLAKLVVEMIERHDDEDVYKLGPIKLVQCLQAISKLQLGDRPLRLTIYSRLMKPDAVSRLPAAFLSHGLSALSSFECKDKDSFLLARSFMRRLRKQKVRDEGKMEDLCKALVACDTLLKTGCMEGYEDEASIFGFTTLRAILQKKENTEHTFTPTEMSSILSAWATLSTGEREDTVITDLLSICHEQKTLESCNLMQVEKIVSSIEKLKLTSNAEIVKAAGERLSTLVKEQLKRPNSKRFDPKIVNQILRCPVLLNRRNNAVMGPYVDAASELFVDEQFLSRCRIGELANFLWFMSIANLNNEEELTALVQRILDPALVDTCSPKLASRILGTYTSILSTASAQGADFPSTIGKMTSKLFHDYGGHLLTTQLTPAEISTTLYAFAKVSYVQDMGIYDHLVSLMASSTRKCSARQLTQGLWSCAKMIVWERTDFGVDEDPATPPYFGHALKIATELSSRESELSPVDVTQCIWALGRLGIKEPLVCKRLQGLLINMSIR